MARLYIYVKKSAAKFEQYYTYLQSITCLARVNIKYNSSHGFAVFIHLAILRNLRTVSRRNSVIYIYLSLILSSGGKNDDFRPLTFTLWGRGMGYRDKYVTS